MAEPMTLQEALEVAEQVSPMPQVAHRALQTMKGEIEALLKVLHFEDPMHGTHGADPGIEVGGTTHRRYKPGDLVMLGIDPEDHRVVITATCADENWLEARDMGLIAVLVTAEDARRYFGEKIDDPYAVAARSNG